MSKYVAYNPDVQVTGKLVLASTLEGTKAVKQIIARILDKHNMGNPNPKSWYPLQDWLDVFEDIEDEIGPHTVFSIGKKMGENAVIPPEIDSIDRILDTMNFAYHMNHMLDGKLMFDMATGQKVEGIGDIECKKIDDKTFELHCKNPYPCEMDKGLITGLSRRFKPEDGSFLHVEHDETKGCRKDGNDGCTYIVSW